jgi:hypothetical protein
LNNAEICILEDIRDHPGTSLDEVVERCVLLYRRTYVITCITRLKALGYVENGETSKIRAMLHAVRVWNAGEGVAPDQRGEMFILSTVKYFRTGRKKVACM